MKEEYLYFDRVLSFQILLIFFDNIPYFIFCILIVVNTINLVVYCKKKYMYSFEIRKFPFGISLYYYNSFGLFVFLMTLIFTFSRFSSLTTLALASFIFYAISMGIKSRIILRNNK